MWFGHSKRLSWPQILKHPFIRDGADEHRACVHVPTPKHRLCNPQFLSHAALLNHIENTVKDKTPSNKTRTQSPGVKIKSGKSPIAIIWPYGDAIHDPHLAARCKQMPEFLNDLFVVTTSAHVPAMVWKTLLSVLSINPEGATSLDADRAFLSQLISPMLSCLSTNIDSVQSRSPILQNIKSMCNLCFADIELDHALLFGIAIHFIPLVSSLFQYEVDRPLILAILSKCFRILSALPFHDSSFAFVNALSASRSLTTLFSLLPHMPDVVVFILSDLVNPIAGIRLAFPLGGEQTDALQVEEIVPSDRAPSDPLPHLSTQIMNVFMAALDGTDTMLQLSSLLVEESSSRPDISVGILRIMRQVCRYDNNYRSCLKDNEHVIDKIISLTQFNETIPPTTYSPAIALLVLNHLDLVSTRISVKQLQHWIMCSWPPMVLASTIALASVAKKIDILSMIGNRQVLSQFLIMANTHSAVAEFSGTSSSADSADIDVNVSPSQWEMTSAELHGTQYGLSDTGFYDACVELIQQGITSSPGLYAPALHSCGLWQRITDGLHQIHVWNWLSPSAVYALIDIVFQVVTKSETRRELPIYLTEAAVSGAISALHEFRLGKLLSWPESLGGGKMAVQHLIVSVVELLSVPLKSNIDAFTLARIQKAIYNRHAVQNLVTSIAFCDNAQTQCVVSLLSKLVCASKHFARQFVDYNGLEVLQRMKLSVSDSSTAILSDVLNLLCQLARVDARHYQHIHKANIYPFILKLFHHAQPDIKVKACNFVGNLCRHSPFFYGHLVEEGILAAVISCSQDSNSQVRKYAAFAIGNAAFHNDDLCRPLAKCIPNLISALSLDGGIDTRLATNSAGALGNLARFSAKVVPELLEFDCVEALLSCIGDVLADPVVRRTCVYSLGNLCSFEPCRVRLQRLPYNRVLAEVASQLTDSQDSLRFIRRILNKMSSSSSLPYI